MRRSYLLAGIAASAFVLFTTATVAKTGIKAQRIQRHLSLVQEMAFCQKGYEIASSFPSYAAHRSLDPAIRVALLKKSDKLDAQRERIGELLRGTFKVEALELGMDEFSYEATLARFEAKAEVDAITTFQSVQNPSAFVDKLDEVCKPYLN